MKNIIKLIILLVSIIGYSQDSLQEETYVKKENFKTIYNRNITSVLNGDINTSTIGSFISLDIAKPNVSVAVSKNWFNSNGYFLGTTTGSFSGGISNGTAKIFEDEELNTGIKFRLEQSFSLFIPRNILISTRLL